MNKFFHRILIRKPIIVIFLQCCGHLTKVYPSNNNLETYIFHIFTLITNPTVLWSYN